MDTINTPKYIICSKCGAINRASNTNCIKCNAAIDSYIVRSDFIQPDFDEMINNIPGNYLTEAGKIIPDISDIFVEPEEEEDVFVPEPDAFGLNGVLPKKSAGSINQQSVSLPPAPNTRSIKFPLEMAGLSVIIVSIILVTISIAALKSEGHTETADAVVITKNAPLQTAGNFSDISIDKLHKAYTSRENGTKISLNKSKTYAIAQKLQNSKYYIDIELVYSDSNDNSNVQYAVNGENYAMVTESKDYTIYEYMVDSKYSAYNSTDKTAVSRTVEADSYEIKSAVTEHNNYILETLSLDIFDIVEPDDDSLEIKSYAVNIDGQAITIETFYDESAFFGTYYYMYDAKGNLKMCGKNFDYYTVVNSFSSSIPARIFQQPSGYKIINQDNQD